MSRILPFPLYGVFNGGLNTRDDPRDLPLNKSPYLRNVEVRSNAVTMTPGYTTEGGTDSDTAANLGLFVASYNGEVWLLKAENGKIKKRKVVGTSPDSAWGNLKTGLNTTALMEFAQANNAVYCTNGVDTVQKWDLTTVPGSTADAATVPKGAHIAYFNRRLVVTHPTDRSRFEISDIDAYETFSSFKYADRGEGGELKRLLDTGRGQLLIMKDNSRYLWNGVDTSTSNPERYSNRGTCAPRSVVVLPSGEILFADHEGVWSGQLFSFGETLISDEIGPTYRALNHSRLSLAAGGYFNDQYLLSVPETGSTVNNATLVFDLQLDERQGGWLYHTFGGTIFTSFTDTNGVAQLIWGSATANSKVYQRYKGDSVTEFNFNGAAIPATHYMKEIDCKEVVPEATGRTKIFLKNNISTKQENNYNLTVGWRVNNDTDFTTVLWSLFGTGTSIWSDTPVDLWSDTPDEADIWEGTQKVEGLLQNFKARGRTIQKMVHMNAINQPFTYYGETIYFLPLKGFK